MGLVVDPDDAPIASARWSKSSCHTRRLRMAGGGPLAVAEETEKGAPGDGATPSTAEELGRDLPQRDVDRAVTGPNLAYAGRRESRE